MRIGFDAKRVFQNRTGLGNYSRTLIQSLADFYPENEYKLFAPKRTDLFQYPATAPVSTITPDSFLGKKFGSLWRTYNMSAAAQREEVNIFHGLSNEIPVFSRGRKPKLVVTIHDLIFERYPQQYKKADRIIYRKKYNYACAKADRVIAISEQTKADLIEFYNIEADKISVGYQSCDPVFEQKNSSESKELIRKKYALPNEYFLYVGSIIERKNLLSICKAIKSIGLECRIPLVVIGEGTAYKLKVKAYLAENNLGNAIIFLSENEAAKNSTEFKNSEHLPAIFQMAKALVYTSVFEGFGIPILEAMWSGIPIICSNVSCMPEVAGKAGLYVDPLKVDEISAAMLAICKEGELHKKYADLSTARAAFFSREKTSTTMMNIYNDLLK